MKLKYIISITLLATLTIGCANQTNPQTSVDTSAQDDLIQLGPNLFQILRKSELSSFPELKRSATIAAAKKCIPLGKEVAVIREVPGFSAGFLTPTKSLLIEFRCI